MNVIVTIEGKEAIPVRAIPLLTDWEILSPDVCARIFSGDDTLEYFEGMSAHRLNPDGGYQVMEQREWANWIARKLRACRERIKAAQASHESGYQQWRQESLALLPAGAFVWREAFEAAHALEYGPNSMRARFNRDTFNPAACELNYDPKHGPCENWRELVMDGFELLTPTQRQAATPTPGVANGASNAPRKARRDLLTPVIEAAQNACGNVNDAPAVWAKLTQMAENGQRPLLGVSDDGIKWQDANDEPQFFKLKNLRDRLRRNSRKAP